MNYKQKNHLTQSTFFRQTSAIALLLISSMVSAQDYLTDIPIDTVSPITVRVGTSVDESVAINLVSFSFDAPAPTWLRADRLELAVGAVTRAEQSRPMLSLGPVWRWQPQGSENRWYVDLGLSPTVLGGGKFDGRDLGGNLHFTSSLEVGQIFGHRSASAVSLRIQHLSNGGLNGANPGLDTVMFGFSYRPGGT